jgi:RNA-binding protein
MTSKQRAKLKSLAAKLDTILHVGKNEIGDSIIKQADDALTAHELIKGCVQDNSDYSAREAAEAIAGETSAAVVQVIGRRFVLYRNNPKKNLIDLGK